MRYNHLILSRFSYRGRDALGHLDGPTWKMKDDPLQPDRLDLRFRLFECTCLPGVLAQTDQAFTWVLIVDKALPSSYRSRLEALLGGRKNFRIHEYDAEERLDRLEWVEMYLESNPEYVVTTNLDDDDVLPANFVRSVREHVFSDYQAGELPPVKTLGVKDIIQWDMISSPDAPLGWYSPWHRKRRASSCGFSLMVKYPQFPFCVLGMKHSLADHYFDFSLPARNRHVELCRSAVIAAASKDKTDLSVHPADRMFCDLGRETGPVVMANHVGNDQKWRLYEGKNNRLRVTGSGSFPGLAVDLDRFQTYSRHFAESLKDKIMAMTVRILKGGGRRSTR